MGAHSYLETPMFIASRMLATAAITAAIAFTPLVTDAQVPIRLGLGVGISMPVGDIAKTSDAGINLVASASFNPARLPFGFDAAASYHNFAPKKGAGGNSFIMSVTGGITIPIAGTVGEPYLMGGAGYYNTQGPTTGATDAERDFGAYGGIGIRFRGEKVQFHVKAAFHEIFAEKSSAGVTRSRELVPLSFTIVL